uniref:hypothetical protein n=1 Tax=Sphingomonas sp. TaxID=28214 RepID=UPI0025D2AAFD
AVAGIPQLFNQVPDTPKYSASGFADVKLPVADSLSVLVHGDVYYQASCGSALTRDPVDSGLRP